MRVLVYTPCQMYGEASVPIDHVKAPIRGIMHKRNSASLPERSGASCGIRCRSLELRQDLALVEVDKPLLIRANLVNVDMIKSGIDVLLDLVDVALRVGA